MAPFLRIGKALTVSFALPCVPQRKYRSKLYQRVHSTVISPFSSFPRPAACGGFPEPTISLLKEHDENENPESSGILSSADKEGEGRDAGPNHESLEQLCLLLGASPGDLLYLSTADDGERGVYLRNAVKKDDVILRIPVSSCLRDDDPPAWFGKSEEDNQTCQDPSGGLVNRYNPSNWATRLGASLVDITFGESSQFESKLEEGLSLWMSMLPNKDYLRASLPVHWDEETVRAAKCSALELTVDASYFSRADAVNEIVMHLRESCETKGDDIHDIDLSLVCNDALDIVQTRTCRVDRENDGGGHWGPPLRLLAPIFDFINHGSSRCNHEGCANAMFRLEGGDEVNGRNVSLVVRATKDIEGHDEVLIDYGDSARPAWRCLSSYGFVPEYRLRDSEGEIPNDYDDGDECVAELYLDGVRFEVGPTTVPFDMVATAARKMAEDSAIIIDGEAEPPLSNLLCQGGMDDERQFPGTEEGIHSKENEENPEANLLTPSVALRMAKRVSDVAFLLLLEPELNIGDDDERDNLNTPEAVIAAKLAASLRWSQHQVLLACAMGLRDYAAREQTF